MPPTPDDDEHGPDEDEASGPSLFEELLADAVAPLTFYLAEQSWTVDVPTADEVAALDTCTDAFDVLDELLGDELADPVLDLLDDMPSYVTDALAGQLLEHFHLTDPPPYGWAELVKRIDKFGAAIEADLPHEWPGTYELEQWFRGERRWPQLYRLLEQLPPGSRWDAALQSDEELAQAQLDEEAEREDEDEDDEPRERPRPPLVGETYDRKLLRGVLSSLLRIEHATYAVHAPKGKSGQAPEPLPGPLTARSLLMRDYGMDEVHEIFAAIEGRDPAEVGRDEPPSGYRSTDSGLVVPD